MQKILPGRYFQFIGILLLLPLCLLSGMVHSETNPVAGDKAINLKAIEALNNGSFYEALTLLNEVLKIRVANTGSNSVTTANTVSNIGNIKFRMGLYAPAIENYQMAADVFSAAGGNEIRKLPDVHQNLAICFNEQGDYEKARAYFESAQRLYEKLGLTQSDNYQLLLLNYISLHINTNELTKASDLIDQVFKTKTTASNEFQKYNYKGLILLKAKKYDESINWFKRAITQGVKDMGPTFPDRESAEMNIGLVYLEMGDLTNSVAWYQSAINVITNRFGQKSVNLSSCWKDIGLNWLKKQEKESNLGQFIEQKRNNLLTSLGYFQKAIIAITPGFDSVNLSAMPDPKDAIDKIRLLEALKLKAEALNSLAKIEEKEEHNETAIGYLKQSLDAYDLSVKTILLIRNGYQNQESRLFLAANEHPVYSEGVVAAIRLFEKTGNKSYFEKGFEFSEKSRSADFQSMMQELQAKTFSSLPDSLVKQEAALKSDISLYENFIFRERSNPKPDLEKVNRLKEKIFDLNQQYQSMVRYIEKQYPNFYQAKYADSVVKIAKIQESLGRREAFIEYFISESTGESPEALYTFVLTADDYKVTRSTPGDQFNLKIDQFLQFLRKGKVLDTRRAEYSRYAQNAYDLYAILLKPVLPAMQNYRLVIVPDEKLSYLPFDAFLASPADTTRMDFIHLDYVVNHHAISYTYSATLLYDFFQKNFTSSTNVAAFAPDYKPTDAGMNAEEMQFQPLPGAEAEVRGVVSLMDGDAYIGEKANKTDFLQHAGHYDILHLAMHTMLNDTLPLYSKIAFTANPGEDNNQALNTFEIYNLKLRSNMVVLSGCNTGSGKLQKGEGVMSLARAFLYAGCPSIIMTLWNVEDEASGEMMSDFYRYIKSGYSKDEALRRAKVNYIKKADPVKAHPYYWLGYVAIGNQVPLFKTKIGYFAGLIIFVFLAILSEKWYFRRKKRISRLK